MGANILIVEDEEPLTTLLRYNLEAEGYDVDAVARGDEADTRLRETAPDLIVLDWMLPGLSGIELCRRLRARPQTQSLPIIMLTARGEESERVRGLATGADDYLVKPFSPGELAARVRSVLRRSRPGAVPARPADGLWVDETSRDVTLDGCPVELTAKEFDLLAFLVRHPRQVFTRAQLLQHVWGSARGWQGEATVTEHVHRLRQKLGSSGDGRPIVQTVRGVGYRMEPADGRG
jgi:two-component system, OmpR family, phosphate regulon response regulator PhoB